MFQNSWSKFFNATHDARFTRPWKTQRHGASGWSESTRALGGRRCFDQGLGTLKFDEITEFIQGNNQSYVYIYTLYIYIILFILYYIYYILFIYFTLYLLYILHIKYYIYNIIYNIILYIFIYLDLPHPAKNRELRSWLCFGGKRLIMDANAEVYWLYWKWAIWRHRRPKKRQGLPAKIPQKNPQKSRTNRQKLSTSRKFGKVVDLIFQTFMGRPRKAEIDEIS